MVMIFGELHIAQLEFMIEAWCMYVIQLSINKQLPFVKHEARYILHVLLVFTHGTALFYEKDNRFRNIIEL